MGTIACMHALTTDGRWVPVRSDAIGELAGGGSGGGGAGAIPASSPTIVEPWSYAGPLGGITDTADDVLIAAAGAGRANYLTSIQISNTHASVDTEVVIKDGSTIIWRRELKALGVGAADIVFERPLISSNNTALNVACVTSGSKTYVNAQGYREASIDTIRAQQTSDLELFDGLGNQMVDGAGNLLRVPIYS
jgi:hypothetical protein